MKLHRHELHIQIIKTQVPLNDCMIAHAFCQSDYVVAEDKGAAISFLMRSGDGSCNPASAAGRKK